MKKNYLIYLLLVGLLTSCGHNTEELNDLLVGEWSLVHVSNADINLQCSSEPGLILWTFTEDQIIVDFDPMIAEPPCPNEILDAGTYDYTIEPDGDEHLILVDDQSIGNIGVQGSQNGSLVIYNHLGVSGIDDNPVIINFRKIKSR